MAIFNIKYISNTEAYDKSNNKAISDFSDTTIKTDIYVTIFNIINKVTDIIYAFVVFSNYCNQLRKDLASKTVKTANINTNRFQLSAEDNMMYRLV